MIDVLASGQLNTVQDQGRVGHRGEGISVAGAMDKVALAAGNRLLGNDPAAAGIEVSILPFAVRFSEDVEIAITGADFGATLDDTPLLPWWVVRARAGQTLRLGGRAEGVFAYLVVSGGIDVPLKLGSRSTDLKIGFGGLDGRSLRKGDRLAVGNQRRTPVDSPGGYGIEPAQSALPMTADVVGKASDTVVRVLPAGEYHKFPDDVLAQYWDSPWTVLPNSNRTACRLSGPVLQANGHRDVMYSQGIMPGTIQVPPFGQPIVQMADANTHGGYPKLGTVIEADLWRLAQARAGTHVRFVQAGRQEALTALAAERAYLRSVTEAVELHWGH